MISKPRARHELLEALRDERGCALCFLATRAAARYIESLLYESVTDVEIREKLRQARGMCNFHSWEMTKGIESLGVAWIYLDLVHFYQRALEEARFARPKPSLLDKLTGDSKVSGNSSPVSPLARRLQPERGCSACEIRGIAEQIYIEALVESVDQVCPLLRDSAGFCLPHLSQIVDQIDNPGDFDRLRDAQAQPLRRIERELSEYIRKHDHRFVHEEVGREGDSWSRAIELLAARRGAR